MTNSNPFQNFRKDLEITLKKKEKTPKKGIDRIIGQSEWQVVDRDIRSLNDIDDGYWCGPHDK